MARDVNGDYELPLPEVESGTVISANWANPTMTDIAVALTDSLDRQGRGAMAAPFGFFNGTVTEPGASWTSEPSTGFYRPALGDLRVTVLGVDLFRWNNGVAQVWSVPDATWYSVQTTQGNVIPSGTADDDGLLWDNTGEEWLAGPVPAIKITYTVGLNVHVLGDEVQAALDSIDLELVINDAHIADDTIHFTEASIDHGAIQNVGVNSHVEIDTHIDDINIHFSEASIDHTAIQNIGSNSHVVIDNHLGSSSNPHSVTAAQAGAADVTGFTSMESLTQNDYDLLAPPDANTLYFILG